MTTLVATRRPLEVLSMSNQADRRKRAAGGGDYERDDDFQFVRKSKKPKTIEAEPVVEEKAPVRKASQRRQAAKVKDVAPEAQEDDDIFYTKKANAAGRKSRTRKASPDAMMEDEQPPTKAPKRATRKPSRKPAPEPDDDEVAQVEISDEASAPPPPPPQTNGQNGTRKPAAKKSTKAAKGAPRQLPPTSPPEPSQSGVSKIALPMSDTPIINRNKEFRKKAAAGGARRSSLGSRGRRASSLIESGSTAIPHKAVKTDQFFKHIEEGLPEPRRMRQLLTWCGERSLSEKPPLGTRNAGAVQGARAIQDQLLKEFSSRSEFSDWFSREDSESTRPKLPLKPNPRNAELDEKTLELEARIKKLQEEKKAWQALQKPQPEPETLSFPTENQEIILPDFSLLDPVEQPYRASLLDGANTFSALKTDITTRLTAVQSSLEFQVDMLADNVHKLEQRVGVAGREADEVLRLSAGRLKEREEREKAKSRTGEMSMMEVLRSLSSVLPEGG